MEQTRTDQGIRAVNDKIRKIKEQHSIIVHSAEELLNFLNNSVHFEVKIKFKTETTVLEFDLKEENNKIWQIIKLLVDGFYQMKEEIKNYKKGDINAS